MLGPTVKLKRLYIFVLNVFNCDSKQRDLVTVLLILLKLIIRILRFVSEYKFQSIK
jgi:hypothetical protein